MGLARASTLTLGLLFASSIFAPPAGSGEADNRTTAFGKLEFQTLLQRFVNEQYLKSFRHLGEEIDFDHGHLLFDPRSSARPVAILYHTQELSTDAALDGKARNWLQWVDRGTVENAERYERREYPHSAAWDWFLFQELPALRKRHTILDKMLDPALLGADVGESQQWVFSRVGCDAPPGGRDLLSIDLPSGPKVCLALDRG